MGPTPCAVLEVRELFRAEMEGDGERGKGRVREGRDNECSSRKVSHKGMKEPITVKSVKSLGAEQSQL